MRNVRGVRSMPPRSRRAYMRLWSRTAWRRLRGDSCAKAGWTDHPHRGLVFHERFSVSGVVFQRSYGGSGLPPVESPPDYDDGDADAAGIREPRRPLPTGDSASSSAPGS